MYKSDLFTSALPFSGVHTGKTACWQFLFNALRICGCTFIESSDNKIPIPKISKVSSVSTSPLKQDLPLGLDNFLGSFLMLSDMVCWRPFYFIFYFLLLLFSLDSLRRHLKEK